LQKEEREQKWRTEKCISTSDMINTPKRKNTKKHEERKENKISIYLLKSPVGEDCATNGKNHGYD
jgi:hypothetical protein